MHKIVSELIVHSNGCTWKTKREKEPIESTGRVLAKNPLNVKLGTEESLRIQECKS